MVLLALETWPFFWCWWNSGFCNARFAVSLLYPSVILNLQLLFTVPGQREHFSEFMRSCHCLTCFQYENSAAGTERSWGLVLKASLRLWGLQGLLGPCRPPENIGADGRQCRDDCQIWCKGLCFSMSTSDIHSLFICRWFKINEEGF